MSNFSRGTRLIVAKVFSEYNYSSDQGLGEVSETADKGNVYEHKVGDISDDENNDEDEKVLWK